MSTESHTAQERQLACQITTSHGHDFPRAMYIRLQEAGFNPVWGETVALNNGHVVNLYLPQDEMPRLRSLQLQAPSHWGPVLQIDGQQSKGDTLSRELSQVALGEMYSERVIRSSVARLESLRDRGSVDPSITAARVDQALVACKLALHGVLDVHHKLQDAALLIAAMEGVEASHWNDLPANEDPRWQEQVEGLRSVTASINAAMAPEAIKAEFDPAMLQEYAEDVGLKFSGQVQKADDGSMSASFTRDAKDGMKYHVALTVPAGGSQVTANATLCKDGLVMVESHPMPRQSALGALDAAVASLADLKVKPVAQATTQAEAQALAARVAGEMGATLGDWMQSQAKEWVHSCLTTDEGKTVRLSASTGGVVSINGDPFTPNADRVLNVTEAAVAVSMRVAIDRTPAPSFPLRTDRVFADAPGEVGAAWANLCEEENRLAGYLSSQEEGTAVVLDGDAWYLEMDEGQQLVLMHGEVVDGKIKNASSRFDFDLGWVDIQAEEVAAYTSRVSSVADDFMIDRALWKTMKVEHSDSPTPGM